ncbi:two-component system, OmpR family, osmolarity sensor histidine kinase EnvZ [Burkholderiales bacterium]|nr:two-component system, OmpR family, osmolarity sensor histidine kinase EnvZ [Burkholderiales bacterium]
MTLLPRSLFGRLTLLLVAVVAIATVSMIVLFRQDRAALVERQFGETKIAQLKALRAALEGAEGPERRETLQRIGREFGARIIPEAERPGLAMGGPPRGPLVAELENRLRAALGPGTEVRAMPGRQQFLVRLMSGDTAYWAAFPMPAARELDNAPSRGLLWSLAIVALLLAAAYAFALYLSRPLRQLNAAVDELGRGGTPSPLPETGPTEIAAVNRRFNAMLANLRQIERDRAVLLAGVSHDLRTPLARLRLGVEMGAAGEDPSVRAGMVADIEEMDRIIGQFLDFARADDTSGHEIAELDPIVRARVDRYAAAGHDVTFRPGGVRPLPMKATAVARLVANLVDNALAYGAPPVEVETQDGVAFATIEVRDRGAGVPPGDVERLKRAFTRSSDARARDDGAAGAGLGLAIVERIARMHGGTFDLAPREGGGTVARVTLATGAR